MTAYQVFLPTLVGMAIALPPANAQPVPHLSSAESELPSGVKEESQQFASATVEPATHIIEPLSQGAIEQRSGGVERVGGVGGVGGVEEVTSSSTSSTSSTSPLSHTPHPIPQSLSPHPTPHTPHPLQSQVPTPQTPVGGVRILTPQSGIIPTRSTSLVIQYPAGTSVRVTVNGDPIDPKTPTQVSRDEAQNTVTQTWYSVRLKDGDNRIEVLSGDNQVGEVRLTVKSFAAKIEISPADEMSVPADGRSAITVTGRITDTSGTLISQDTTVTLTASAGKFVGADEDEDAPGFQVVARGGQFTARLQSNVQAQQVRIRAAVATGGNNTYQQFYNPLVELDPNGYLVIPFESPIPDSNLAVPYNSPVSPSLYYAVPREIETYTQVEFVPNIRRSIASGVINLRIGERGTDYWGSLRDFLRPDKDGTEVNLSAQVFATGAVFGDWLFTGAYNSERSLNENCEGDNRLFGGRQFCEQLYPVYGDSSTIDYLTPSKDSVFARLERPSRTEGAEIDYLMWGDYNTREFARASQVFTATSRQLHGFKGNYSFGNLQVTALYSPDVEGFQRDTIAPDGTSGYYFLSRRLLVPGSERVYLETQELSRPGTVVERQLLNRGPDYEIDYDRGTLKFRRPVYATDFDPFYSSATIAGTDPTLRRQIVVTYQFEGGDDTDVMAGRLQYNFSNSLTTPSWAALSYWRENQGDQDFDLLGGDFYLPLGNRARIVGEVARSNTDSVYRGNITGYAYRVEATGAITSNLAARAYYRSVDEDFFNNATFSFTPGQTRYGASVTAQLTPTTLIEASYDYEKNFGIAPAVRTGFFDLFNPGYEARPGDRVDNSLETFAAGIRQRIWLADLSVNYVHRNRDDNLGTFDGDADQIVTRLNVPIVRNQKDKSNILTFRAQNETNFSNEDPLYPDRTTVGLDWAAYPGITVRLAHQFFDGGLLDDNSITSLDTIVERQLWKNTNMTSRYSIISGNSGMIGQGALGIRSGFYVAPGLRLSLGFERIQNDIFSQTGAGPRFAQPYAIGQSSSSLGIDARNSFNVGLEYTDNPDFKASIRGEYRTGGSDGDNFLIDAGAAGKLSRSLTALLRYQMGNYANQLIDDLGDSMDIRVGLAYRNPDDDRFNALLKYEFRQNAAVTPDTELFEGADSGSAHVLSVEGIFAPTWRWEFFGKYAMRNSYLDYNDDFNTDTFTQIAQMRATFRLAYRVDVAGEVRWIGQDSYDEWGWAAELGYYLTPDLRVGLGYSFGSVDDRDFTGYRSRGGPYFQVTFKVNELLGGFGRQRPIPRPRPDLPVAMLTHIEPFAIASSIQTTGTSSLGLSPLVNLDEMSSLMDRSPLEIDPALGASSSPNNPEANANTTALGNTQLIQNTPQQGQINNRNIENFNIFNQTNISEGTRDLGEGEGKDRRERDLEKKLGNSPLPPLSPSPSSSTSALTEGVTNASPLMGTGEWVVKNVENSKQEDVTEVEIYEILIIPNFAVSGREQPPPETTEANSDRTQTVSLAFQNHAMSASSSLATAKTFKLNFLTSKLIHFLFPDETGK